MTRTSVILDPKIQVLAEDKHQRIFHEKMNYSAFFRACLESWVYSKDDHRPLWEQASDIVEQIKKEAREQQQIQQFESEKSEKEKIRSSSIREAVRQEVNRIGNDRFRRYFLEDHYGDYQRIQDDTIAVISKSSGQPVELSDVITAYKEVRAS